MVLELKRQGEKLDNEDRLQGLSYARLLAERPPLVVVSNGDNSIILEAHTGEEWQPETANELAVDALIRAAGKVAANDMASAMEVLLGPTSNVWAPAFRATSENVIRELSGRWDDYLLPFMSGFLIPREITRTIVKDISKGSQIVIVTGSPITGKSTVLRELASAEDAKEDYAMLLVEADSAGTGLFQIIANLLSEALGWPLTTDGVRGWLQRHGAMPDTKRLVIGIDGVGSRHNAIRSEIEELVGGTFGAGVTIILTTELAQVELLTRTENRRGTTRIGRLSTIRTVEPLSLSEFSATQVMLQKQHIHFIDGAEHAPEYRVPWLLRILVGPILESPKLQSNSAVIDPGVGLATMAATRRRFDNDSAIRGDFRLMAEAVRRNASSEARNAYFLALRTGCYAASAETLESVLGAKRLERVTRDGFLEEHVARGRRICTIKVPELIVSETARILTDELVTSLKRDEPASDLAKLLMNSTEGTLLGDLVAAQVIIDTAHRLGAVPGGLLAALYNMKPKREAIEPNSQYVMQIDGKVVDLRVDETGRILAMAEGREPFELREAGPGKLTTSLHPWLVLSHLASWRMMEVLPDGTMSEDLSFIDLLLDLASCPVPLRRPGSDIGLLIHSIPGHGEIVCERNGFVEPVTFGLFQRLRKNGSAVEERLVKIIEQAGLAFLSRLQCALNFMHETSTKQDGVWAARMMKEHVGPRLDELPALHTNLDAATEHARSSQHSADSVPKRSAGTKAVSASRKSKRKHQRRARRTQRTRGKKK